MNEFDIDFHIHSRYSGGVSPEMRIPTIAEHAQYKGLKVVGTGDCIHDKWLQHIKDVLIEEKNGLYKTKKHDTLFIIQTEVEDENRIHHVILLPSIDAAEKLREKIKPHSSNIDSDGRPNVKLNPEKIAELTNQEGGLIGPSHAFTPYTAIFKKYTSIEECYKSQAENIHFLELGLSADTDMADKISNLADTTFMTNSDCHSPWPHRLGREFNRIQMKDLSFNEIIKALKREDGRKFTLNVGLNPNEGKYHLTACQRCYKPYKLQDALKIKRRCPLCQGIIKMGVEDRISEMGDNDEPIHPKHRPAYIHILPLAEVISLAVGVKTLTSKKIQTIWHEMIEKFGTEIHILLDEKIPNIRSYDEKIADIIGRFREGKIYYIPGGGGSYGRASLTKVKIDYWDEGQKNLLEY